MIEFTKTVNMAFKFVIVIQKYEWHKD
jgi:hypothetical protein